MSSAYFDHNATTAVDDGVLAAMLPYFHDRYGNPSSRHRYGREARRAIDEAREQVAATLGAASAQVIFTSGGTEANNLALHGLASRLQPSRLLVSAIEHPCVMQPALALARKGWGVRQLAVTADGVLDAEDLYAALAEPTALASVMLANNETGVLLDVAQVVEEAHQKGALVHTDAVQALGKVAVCFDTLGVDAMTISGHKIHGPKGVGALIVDKRIDLQPMITGGGHEKGLRAGTENVPAIVGLAAACRLAEQDLARKLLERGSLRDRLERGLKPLGAVIFGERSERLPNTSDFAFPGIDGETLVMALDQAGYAVASGAACSSGSSEASHVLQAMGVAWETARGAVRVSLGRDNTAQEVDGFLQVLAAELGHLRNLPGIAFSLAE
ncbi:MAG TPA: cysteine desulfurase [Betaproteobacteria bacterium]|nr:cysteine desulfurase [Betaproteobacteria bacterium]